MIAHEKLSIEEAVFECYRNMRTDYEILLYLGKGGHPRIVNKSKLLRRFQVLAIRNAAIQINNMISYRKPSRNAEPKYDGYIITALDQSNLSNKFKRSLWNKIYRNKATILEIQTTRDKYYAHLDLDYRSKIRPNTVIFEYGRIIFMIASIIQRIYGTKKFELALKEIESRDDYDLLENYKGYLI